MSKFPKGNYIISRAQLKTETLLSIIGKEEKINSYENYKGYPYKTTKGQLNRNTVKIRRLIVTKSVYKEKDIQKEP